MASFFRAKDVMETSPLMAGGAVATCVPPAGGGDTETAARLPVKSTISGAVPRRFGGRAVAAVAVVTATAAVSLLGIAGSAHVVSPQLGALPVQPQGGGGRGVDVLVDHRPGEDLWDMIDRGLTETKRSSSGDAKRGAAELGASEESDGRTKPNVEQESRLAKTTADARNLGSVTFDDVLRGAAVSAAVHASPSNNENNHEFDELTEQALSRMPQARRVEARRELRRLGRESGHSSDAVATRSAERYEQRKSAKQFERKRTRFETRRATARAGKGKQAPTVVADRSRMGAAETSDDEVPTRAAISEPTEDEKNGGQGDVTDDEVLQPEFRVDQVPERAAISEPTEDEKNARVTLDEDEPSFDSGYDAYGNDYDADEAADAPAEAPGPSPAPHHDPNAVAARREARIRVRLKVEALAEETRLQAGLDDTQDTVRYESLSRFADEAKEIENEIHETTTTREFRQTQTEQALTSALDTAQTISHERDVYEDPGNRTVVGLIDTEIAGAPVAEALAERADEIVDEQERLQRELDDLELELEHFAEPEVDDVHELDTLAFETSNATLLELSETFEDDDFVWETVPTAEALAAADAAANAARANATAASAARNAERVAAVVRAETRAISLKKTIGDLDADDLVAYATLKKQSRAALRMQLRHEEAAANATALSVEAQRVADDASARQELAALRARLAILIGEESVARSREDDALRVLNLQVEDAESNHSGEMEREEETRYASDDHYANAPSPGAYDFLPTETGGPLDQHDDSEYDPGDTDDMGWHDLTRSAAASAAASAGKSRFGDDSDAETQNLPKRFLEEIVSKRNRVRRRSEGRATQREEKKQESAVERTLESDAERRQQRRRRNTVDLNGWAMDDSWDPGTAGRLGLVVGPQDTSDTESSVARLAGVGDAAEAEEVADALSLTESARHPHTAKRSLEDILGAELDLETREPSDVARPGAVAGTAFDDDNGYDYGFSESDDTVASVLGHATAATTDRPEKTFQKAFHNAFGPVPGLLRHVRGKIGLPPAKQVGSFRVRDIDPLALQVLTYANSAYWPVTKVLLKSLSNNAPDVLPSLTVMLTDTKSLVECENLAVTMRHTCFLDRDMVTVLGKFAEREGSQAAGSETSEESEVGKALRVAWCWRKVHAVYSLVKGGYPAVFIDASTVVLQDFRGAVAQRLALAEMVTLSDFGGQKEQQAINTGLLAAAPDTWPVMLSSSSWGKHQGSNQGGDDSGLPSLRQRNSLRLLEEWMGYEPTATDTEQAYLTWDLAPKARLRGDVIIALPHEKFPSFVTFEEHKHVPSVSGGNLGNLEAGLDDVVRDENGHEVSDENAVGIGVTVHAAYCGSVEGKLAFLTRIESLQRGVVSPVTLAEKNGCDGYDRDKYRNCGAAPWDGDC